MNMNRSLIFAVLGVSGLICMSAQAGVSVRGQVVDDNGVPVGGVKWMISAFEEFQGGKWIHVFNFGAPRIDFSDSNGEFAIPFNKNQRYDLQFSKHGYAPAFLFQVEVNSPEIKVVLKRGVLICGTVSNRAGATVEPVIGETVILRLPCRDFWYQEQVLTDHKGRYEFHACAPPDEPDGIKRKWQVVVAGKVVEIDVRDGEPVDEVNIEIDVKVKKKL